MRFAVIIEKAKNNYCAFVPDLPGCVATGRTIEDTQRMIKEAIEFHIEGMQEDGDLVPEPTSQCCYVNAKVGKPVSNAREKRRVSSD